MSVFAEETEKKREIEEIVVTAEKVESTVSDTSLSITAFSADMIEEFGMQDADEMVDFLPATTRDDYDIRIRGVGRNFRALGGDEGVATYYNGVYSPDFGIAATENALYDLERIEVLRGPQGTLYGKNSLGGAINYVTSQPTFDWEGEIRSQLGKFNTREFYGVISGPVIEDVLAMRLVANQRLRDGSQPGVGGSPDINSIDDRNVSLALTWNVNDAVTYRVRFNDRHSDRALGTGVFLTEGPAPARNVLSNDRYVLGLRKVDESDPGAMPFTNPLTNEVVYGAFNRPGLDSNEWPHSPNALYGVTASQRPLGLSAEDPLYVAMVNDDPGCDKFPYTSCASNHERFVHSSVQTEIEWQISDDTRLKYIYGYTDFKYSTNVDTDLSNVEFTKSRTTVLEDVQNYSHEIQLDWAIGENFRATSGAFYFRQLRSQDYSQSNTTPRYTNVTDYGALAEPTVQLGGRSILDVISLGEHVRLWSTDVGTSNFGAWEGDPRGDMYHHENSVRTEASALFTQGTYAFNDEFELVLGARYARDRKGAIESRGGYAELSLPWAMGFIGTLPGAGGAFPGSTTGLTELGVLNVAMGNATMSGNPNDPLTPVCALTDATCSHPLRLGEGMPISWSSYIRDSDVWSDLTYRINLNWTPSDEMLMYFSVTTGYRAGGYSLGLPDARDQARDEMGFPIPGSGILPLKYDSEVIRATEIGYKGLFLNNTFQVGAALYHYQYESYQDSIATYDPIRDEVVETVQNAEGAQNYGFEMEVLWLPGDRWTVGGNYSFTESKYDGEYSLLRINDPAVPPSLFFDDPELFLFSIDRNDLKGIPADKYTVWAGYGFDSEVGRWDFSGSYSFTGEYTGSAYGLGLDQIPARQQLNVSVSWRDTDNRWSVRAFVDNVTDENNLRSVWAAQEKDNWRQGGSPLYPRYWGVDIKYQLR